MIKMVIASILLIGGINVFNGSGARREGKTTELMTPRVVIDTVRITGGYGSLLLNSVSSTERGRTEPSGEYRLFVAICPILSDSTETVYAYGCTPKTNRLLIKSSGGAADTSLVTVVIWVQ